MKVYFIEVPPPIRHQYSKDFYCFDVECHAKKFSRFLKMALKLSGFDNVSEEFDWERNYQETREQEHQEEKNA